MSRTRFEASLAKRRAVRDAEASGDICDSIDVRTELMRRVKSGEITLLQAQEELKAIKRQGRREGKLTRSQVFNRA
jgi:hypothetical protein